MPTRRGIPTGRSKRGFTLIELLISIVVFAIIMGAVFALLNRTQGDFVRQRDVSRGLEALRTAEIAISTILNDASTGFNS